MKSFYAYVQILEKILWKNWKEEYIDGAYEQSHHQNHRQVKAYNYRVYKVCQKKIKKFLKERNSTFTQNEIEVFIEDLTL